MPWLRIWLIALCAGLAWSASAAGPQPSVELGLARLGVLHVQAPAQPLAIPDADPHGVALSLALPKAVGPVRDVDVLIGGSDCTTPQQVPGLQHSWVGDLELTLFNPTGASAILMQRPGGGLRGSSGDDFCQTWLDDDHSGPSIDTISAAGQPPLGPPYTGRLRPHTPLAALDGTPAGGVWTLLLRDLEPQDSGILHSVTLAVSTTIFTPTAQLTVDETYGRLALAVVLDTAQADPLTVPYAVSGTADSTDHTFTSGTLTIPAGERLGWITGTILDNAPDGEAPETLVVTLQPGAALPGPSHAITVTLLDELASTAPTLAITGSLGLEQGGSVQQRSVGQVSDAESTADSVALSIAPPGPQIDLAITNQAGVLVVTGGATCDATPGVYSTPITATDTSGLTSTTTLLVGVQAPAGTCGPNGLALVATPASLAAPPGAVVSTTLRITNTGPLSATFDLEVRTATWPVALSQSTVALAAGESASVSVDVSIPAQAAGLSFDDALLAVTATSDARIERTLTLRTRAVVGRLVLPLLRK